MANRFIQAMEKAGDRSEERLRRLYRVACKRLHPDAAGPGSNAEAFLSLRNDYEEAVAILASEAALASESAAARNAASAEAAAPDSAAKNAGAGKTAEPVPLAAFRSASARFGSEAALAGCDAYAWVPSDALIASVADAARGLYASTDRPDIPADASGLIAVLEAARAERELTLRYPGIMTRYIIMYKAFASWRRYRSDGSAVDADAARTRLDDLEDSRSTLVRSKAMAHVTEAFPWAAMTLRAAWGLGDPRIISG